MSTGVSIGPDQAVLGQEQDRDDPHLAQVAEKFVHLQDQETLVRHRVEVAVEAVDDDDARLVALDAGPHQMGELTGRHLGGINLLDAQRPGCDEGFDVQADGFGPSVDGAAALVEGEDDGVVAAPCRRDREGQCQRRLAHAGRSDEQGVRAALQAPPSSASISLLPLCVNSPRNRL